MDNVPSVNFEGYYAHFCLLIPASRMVANIKGRSSERYDLMRSGAPFKLGRMTILFLRGQQTATTRGRLKLTQLNAN